MVGPLGVVATIDETSRFGDDVMFFFCRRSWYKVNFVATLKMNSSQAMMRR